MNAIAPRSSGFIPGVPRRKYEDPQSKQELCDYLVQNNIATTEQIRNIQSYIKYTLVGYLIGQSLMINIIKNDNTEKNIYTKMNISPKFNLA